MGAVWRTRGGSGGTQTVPSPQRQVVMVRRLAEPDGRLGAVARAPARLGRVTTTSARVQRSSARPWSRAGGLVSVGSWVTTGATEALLAERADPRGGGRPWTLP